MQQHFGDVVGYGLSLLIWEVVAQNGDENFRLPVKGKYDLNFWARELGTASKKFIWQTLLTAAACNVIDADALNELPPVVSVPALREHLDDFAKRRARELERKSRRKKLQKQDSDTTGT